MQKTAAAFALLAGVMAAQAQADPLLDAIAHEAAQPAPAPVQRVPTTAAEAVKIRDFCTHFNQVVAPTLKATGIEASFYADMDTINGEPACFVKRQTVAYDPVVTVYDYFQVRVGDDVANAVVADEILQYVTPADRARIVRTLPDILRQTP
jgi:hypothetical protein